jgi:deoxyribose-phosphate aldolase
MTTTNLARAIDHTLLRADATLADIEKLCREAVEYGFFSVCVNGSWVEKAASLVADSPVKVACVVGFPLGAMATSAKAVETTIAVTDGASEIDMVLPVGPLKSGDHRAVNTDIRAVTEAASGRTVKVIFETCLLAPDEIVAACRLSIAAGAHFVKTSTGFSTGGATVDTVRLMRETVGPDVGVKASGGIRDTATALAMLEAGASRLGTSAGVAIVTGVAPAASGY